MQLDNLNIIKKRDKSNAISVIANSYKQLSFEARVEQFTIPHHPINNVILSGMGGSCLAGLIAKNWLDFNYDLSVPFEVIRDYCLPSYVNSNSLVICFSVSGNTEETLSSLDDAMKKCANVVVITSGGKLLDQAKVHNLPYIKLDKVTQPRYGILMHLRSIIRFINYYGLIHEDAFFELSSLEDNIKKYTVQLLPNKPIDQNQAKQLALFCAGKTPLIYSSRLFRPLSYKWKTSFNENAKNIIWNNEFPEFNHNEFIGWTSHPINKPFAVIDFCSDLDNPKITKRLKLSDKLLSGKRPKSYQVKLQGNSFIEQVINGAILGDLSSIYLGILNGVDPTPVELVEKFKFELNKK